jgi:hypothetical protein
MAFERLEPFGAPAAEWRAGMLASVQANIHRDRSSNPLGPADFSPLLRAMLPEPGPVLMDDPVAHAKLIKSMVFGVKSEDDDV